MKDTFWSGESNLEDKALTLLRSWNQYLLPASPKALWKHVTEAESGATKDIYRTHLKVHPVICFSYYSLGV